MKNKILVLSMVLCLTLVTDSSALARFGGFRGGAVGGFRGGAIGGYRGGAVGGVRYGGVEGYRGGAIGGARYGEAGGVRYGGVEGYRGGAVGGVRTGGVRYGEAGGVRYGGVEGYRGGAVGGVRTGGVDAYRRNVDAYRTGAIGGVRTGATSFGFDHVSGVAANRSFVAAGHRTYGWSTGVVASRGVAVRRSFYNYNLFTPTWWGAHPRAWRPVRWANYNAWAWSTWPALVGWFGYANAPDPIYYDYGTNVVYQDNSVYVNNQPVATAPQYYQQAQTIAEAQPAAQQPEEAWQSLGVFGLSQGQSADSAASAVFQLAVNKEGVIKGNYYNVLVGGSSLPVQGSVDQKTQRAAWTVGDNKTTVYETGIYNLTKDQTPVLVHFGPDRTEQWLLVRMNEQNAKQNPGAGGTGNSE